MTRIKMFDLKCFNRCRHSTFINVSPWKSAKWAKNIEKINKELTLQFIPLDVIFLLLVTLFSLSLYKLIWYPNSSSCNFRQIWACLTTSTKTRLKKITWIFYQYQIINWLSRYYYLKNDVIWLVENILGI